MKLDYSLPHRYLVSFHSKQQAHYFVDFLVIGGGVAGLRAALACPPDTTALVISKDGLAQSNSAYAQGGIAGVLDPDDCFESHIEDTIDAGKGLCNRKVVEQVVREAPRHIYELVDWDTQFDRIDGDLDLTQEGGHSRRRVVHALGDATGKELMRAMIATARSKENLTFWENTFTLDLLTYEGRCCGALVWNSERGYTMVWAKATVLATGGAGQLFRETTNPDIATADGHALAFRAGAQLRDMEMMQFHPTVLYIAGSARWLITEAMRGEGAYLRDSNGERYMVQEHPQAELAPRDEVSRASVRQMKKTHSASVFLDLRHLNAGHVRKRFPMIAQVCRKFGLDIAADLIPVRPGAHYMIGGICVDSDGKPSVPGLLAAGEVTSTGLHGANRLGSNSLLEGLVYGAHAGEYAAREIAENPEKLTPCMLENRGVDDLEEPLNITDVRDALRSVMWRWVGIERDRTGLHQAWQSVDFWCQYVLPRQFSGPEGWQLQNMLTVAQLIIRSANAREETRGVHYRSDFPETDDQRMKGHISIQAEVSERC